jgi:hypothetical protein
MFAALFDDQLAGGVDDLLLADRRAAALLWHALLLPIEKSFLIRCADFTNRSHVSKVDFFTASVLQMSMRNSWRTPIDLIKAWS